MTDTHVKIEEYDPPDRYENIERYPGTDNLVGGIVLPGEVAQIHTHHYGMRITRANHREDGIEGHLTVAVYYAGTDEELLCRVELDTIDELEALLREGRRLMEKHAIAGAEQ